jgi:hypothetical protein
MCKVKRWSITSTPLDVLSQEIEEFLNDSKEGEVRIFQCLILNNFLVLIAVFNA